MIEIKSELDKKKDISDLKDNISDLKNKNLLINKYKKEIQELKEKLNDKDDTSEIKSNDDENKKEEIYDDDIPHLETEEEAVERIADFHEKKGKGYIDLPKFCLN